MNMAFFEYKHLPPRMQEISAPLGQVADSLVSVLLPCAEREAGLRKLLEAKDCFVRARLEQDRAAKEKNDASTN